MNGDKELTVVPGGLYEISHKKYRVFYARDGLIGLFGMGSAEFLKLGSDAFFRHLSDGTYKKVQEPPQAGIVTLSRGERMAVREKADAMNRVLEELHGRWECIASKGRKEACVHEAAESLHIGVRHFRVLLYRYIRSGLDENSLIDGRKTRRARGGSPPAAGQSGAAVKREDALEYAWQVFKSSPNGALAYKEMLYQHYFKGYKQENLAGGGMKSVPDFAKDAPGRATVYRYIEKRLPEGMTMAQYKAGQRDYMNNHRLKTGTQRSGLAACGQLLQADEWEADVQLVDEGGRVIGKPVVYAFFDPYAQIIVSLYIGFSNNSIDGPVNLLLSLMEPHNNQTKPYGVTFEDHEFPWGFLPAEIRCDQGAEYMSGHMRDICGELGITLSPVPAGTGSNKGGVEGTFYRFHVRVERLLYDSGYIRRAHGGPEAAKENAVLSISGFRKICYRMVKELNTSPLGPKYKPNAEELEDGIPPVPSELWKYYTKNKFLPLTVTDSNREQFMYSLLWRDRKFKKGDDGISCKGTSLAYFSNEDWFIRMIRSGSESCDFEVRYNKSDISYVYVRYEDRIHRVCFPPARDDLRGMEGWTWDAYDEFWKGHKKRMGEARKDALWREMETLDANKETLAAEAAARGGAVNDKGSIPEARAMERAKLETDPGEVRNRLLSGQQGTDPAAPGAEAAREDAGPEDPGSGKYRPTTLDDLLRMMGEGADE